MSLASDGRFFTCDWCSCTATALAPVALRPVLSSTGQTEAVVGWLSVSSQKITRHFCPGCAAEYLTALRENAEEPPPTITHLGDATPAGFVR